MAQWFTARLRKMKVQGCCVGGTYFLPTHPPVAFRPESKGAGLLQALRGGAAAWQDNCVSVPCTLQVLLLTDDAGNRSRAAELGIQALSTLVCVLPWPQYLPIGLLCM